MIVIIGAGIAGLSLGYELIKRGAPVTVLDASTVASGASGVATSYLEPRLGSTPIRAVEWEALNRWHHYVEAIEHETQVDVEFRTEGQLRVTLEESRAKFEKDLTDREAQGWQIAHLPREEALKREPTLSPEIIAAAYLPNVRWVTGKKFCEALAAAIIRRGGSVLENETVFSMADNCLTTTKEKLRFEKLVLCNGMGATKIDAVPSDIPQSRPVRGVNLVVDQSGLSQPLTHMVKHHRGNLCPRSSGRLIVGTTYEPGETSLEPDEEVIEKLYANATPILPNLRHLPLIEITAGLRTKVGDGNLTIGRSVEQTNVYFSLSHAGAGFLRAPVVAPELAEFVLNSKKGEFTGFLTSA